MAVIDRKKIGVDVRVMLNPNWSRGDRANDEECFESPALVSTFNLSPKYFTHTRDYGIITHHPHHVAQIVEVFNIDWEYRDSAPSTYEGLLWR